MITTNNVSRALDPEFKSFALDLEKPRDPMPSAEMQDDDKSTATGQADGPILVTPLMAFLRQKHAKTSRKVVAIRSTSSK
eukprot:scaffold270209_cov47-Prasinocladus_malaysianus.AAC.1